MLGHGGRARHRAGRAGAGRRPPGRLRRCSRSWSSRRRWSWPTAPPCSCRSPSARPTRTAAARWPSTRGAEVAASDGDRRGDLARPRRAGAAAATEPAAGRSPAQWPPAGAEPVAVDALYAGLADVGYDYGPLFQGLPGGLAGRRRRLRRGRRCPTTPAATGVRGPPGAARRGAARRAAGQGHPASAADAAVLLVRGAARDRRRLARSRVRIAAGGRARGCGSTSLDETGAPVVSVDRLAVRPVDPAQLADGGRRRPELAVPARLGRGRRRRAEPPAGRGASATLAGRRRPLRRPRRAGARAGRRCGAGRRAVAVDRPAARRRRRRRGARTPSPSGRWRWCSSGWPARGWPRRGWSW